MNNYYKSSTVMNNISTALISQEWFSGMGTFKNIIYYSKQHKTLTIIICTCFLFCLKKNKSLSAQGQVGFTARNTPQMVFTYKPHQHRLQFKRLNLRWLGNEADTVYSLYRITVRVSFSTLHFNANTISLMPTSSYSAQYYSVIKDP